jgi:hypothetical protein
MINHQQSRLSSTALLLLLIATPALAQQAPSHLWIDIDDVFATPTDQPQSYSVSKVLFNEVATSSLTYSPGEKTRIPAFGGGAQIYRGVGFGVRLTAVDRQTTPAAITLNLPDPLFFDRPHTARIGESLDRSERTVDLAAAYVVPIPKWFSVRAFAGRSRVRITQSLIDQVTYKYPDADGGVTIVSVTHQTANAYAWGSLVGVDAGFFPLRNVGIGLELARRAVDVPTQSEPFSAHPFTLSPHRTKLAIGLRLRL